MSTIELAIIGYVRAPHGPKHNESLFHKTSDFMRFNSHFQSHETLLLSLAASSILANQLQVEVKESTPRKRIASIYTFHEITKNSFTYMAIKDDQNPPAQAPKFPEGELFDYANNWLTFPKAKLAN